MRRAPCAVLLRAGVCANELLRALAQRAFSLGLRCRCLVDDQCMEPQRRLSGSEWAHEGRARSCVGCARVGRREHFRVYVKTALTASRRNFIELSVSSYQRIVRVVRSAAQVARHCSRVRPAAARDAAAAAAAAIVYVHERCTNREESCDVRWRRQGSRGTLSSLAGLDCCTFV